MSRYVLDVRTVSAHFPGIGRYVRDLTHALVPQLATDEELLLLWNPTDPTAWNPTALTGAQVHVIELCASPFSLQQQWGLPRLLRRQGTSLYHSPYYLMPYWPGVPTLLTVHDLIPLLQAGAVSPRARLFFRLTLARALQSARQVIVVSKATQRDLLTYFPIEPDRLAVIPEAAAPHFSAQPPENIKNLRQKYGLPSRYLFYLGINKPHKNLVRLIDAYALLVKDTTTPTLMAADAGENDGGPGSSPPALVIAGAWDERYPEPRQWVDKLGLSNLVRFLGPVADEDLPALYSGCTLFVFPSLYEGFGLPVLEAMACGAPVLCSNTSSLPEVAGDAALLFDPVDVDAIVAAMQRVLSDDELRRSLARRSLQQAQHFSWQQTAKGTLALYRRTAAKR